MSTLTVLIPPRDAAETSAGAGLPGAAGTSEAQPGADRLPASAAGGLRYVLTDRRGTVLQSGTAPLGLLPAAQATCLVLAARDVLLVDAPVPPLQGARLQQALPNIIEDWLLPDTAPVHIVAGPLPGAGAAAWTGVGGIGRFTRRAAPRRPRLAAVGKAASVRTLAAVDRTWLRDLLTRFAAAGHKALRVVPMSGCLPLPGLSSGVGLATDGSDDASVSVLLDDSAHAATVAQDGTVEVTLRRRPHAGGERVDVADAGPDTLLTPAAGAGLARAAASAESAVDGRDVVSLADIGTAAPVEGSATRDDAGHARALADASGAARIDAAAVAALDEDDAASLEAHRLCGEGLRIARTDIDLTLDMIAPHRTLYYLVAGTDDQAMAGAALRLRPGARPYTMAQLAQAAQRCVIDLCQFEFAPKGLRLSGALWRQVRWPVMLVLASVVVTLIGLNLRWAQLVHQRNAVQAAMTERLLSAFPSTTVVLDPVVQMTRSLDALRVAAGELSPNDFLTLTNGLSLSMGGISPNGIGAMTYDGSSLQVLFRSDAQVDAGLRDRLARQGLDASMESRPDGQRWTIRSRR
ncbi:type II secretion system protein GspL [Robbsia sp. KACC 23696]|uniref:type II secretion system protein GspL n=1 Tax=Robbsia sp. KACC 23696 TaxID=3149231 RepID=UPI00325A8529